MTPKETRECASLPTSVAQRTAFNAFSVRNARARQFTSCSGHVLAEEFDLI
ncbi:hypothetical protein CORC01_00989 [Colletotrichum orchidophilum]|uniref:Uncharacterized protein n=1 Tax=Colletotrichum orchidophilum TaxID=1209926 RepID=A0A1G4BQH6_9PEZI|nr:uncharacterized protein CORC01_00989 [Colletotrichum orchidophilum]OHF03670.1 hypothetical protein CORC01_00989 [Colletotrichum orchidophilum]